MTQIIAISNQKGGVAKTTSCFCLGACLAEQGYRTLIVDLDAQANLTLSVGLDPDEIDWSIADLFENQTDNINHAILLTPIEGMEILPADLRLASIERWLFDQENYETILKKILLSFKVKYDYILLDCPPSLGSITLSALSAANRVLIPLQCEYYAAQGLLHLLGIADAIRQRNNPQLSYSLVVTMYDSRNRINREIYNQLRLNFSKYLLRTLINMDTHLREAAVMSEPITTYAPKSRASIQYRQLAQEIITISTSEVHSYEPS